MTKRIIILVVALIAVLMGVAIFRSSEPSYQGRSLTSWLEQYQMAEDGEGQPSLVEAQTAIRAIGAKKALPHLFRMIEARDGPMHYWLDENIPMLKLRSAGKINELGFCGFKALGTAATPGIPKLMHFAADPSHRSAWAVSCLGAIGPPGAAGVTGALTNSDWVVRATAVIELRNVEPDDLVLVGQLTAAVGDTNTLVHRRAIYLLCSETNHPEEIVPILSQALNDPYSEARYHAALTLCSLGTNARPAFGALSNFIAQANAKDGTKILRTLRISMPQDALPIALSEMQSTDSGHRLAASIILMSYETATPEIAAALKDAAEDPDPNVRRVAAESADRFHFAMGDTNLLSRPFPADEPSYRGHTLREWLKIHRSDPVISRRADAADAIRKVGTNAVPTLEAMLTQLDPATSRPDLTLAWYADDGFRLIGRDGAAAIDLLNELIRGPDEDLAIIGVSSAISVGENPATIRGLREEGESRRNPKTTTEESVIEAIAKGKE